MLVLPLPLLYEFCEFFGIQYAIGIGTTAVFNVEPSAPASTGSTLSSQPAAAALFFQLFATALAAGLISAVSATRPNTPRPVPTCVSW